MAKNKRYLILILLLLCGRSVNYSNDCIESAYLGQVGVRELTKHNDGQRVEEYLRTVNMPKGNAWCAAFVKWCLQQCDIPNNVTAWAPTAANPKNIVYKHGSFLKQYEPGDVFTIYSYKLNRVAHTGFVHRIDGNSVTTVEGNTNNNGSREGDGVYIRTRPLYSIYTISRWK